MSGIIGYEYWSDDERNGYRRGTDEGAATIARLTAELAGWVRLGRRMSAVIAEPDDVDMPNLTALWQDIDKAIEISEPKAANNG